MARAGSGYRRANPGLAPLSAAKIPSVSRSVDWSSNPLLEWLLYGVLVVALAVLIVPATVVFGASNGSGTPLISLSPTSAAAGATVTVAGSNFATDKVQLLWDGSSNGMPTTQGNGKGTFKVNFVVPLAAAVGSHTVGAVTLPGGGGPKAKPSSSATAQSGFSVLAAVAAASPQPTATPTPTLAPAPSPTPTPTATPTQAPITTTVGTPIPSTIAGDCTVDVTTPILNWIASVPNNSTLLFGNGACYRIDGTLEIFDRFGLTFEGNGSTFRASTTGAGTRAHWRPVGGTNLVFRDMTIHGSNPNGGVLNQTLQWQHGIDVRGSAGVEVANVIVTDVYGDGIYLGQDWRNGARSRTVRVHDSTIARTGRNGVAVTAGRDVTVEANNVSEAGFDIFDVEPNSTAGQGAYNVTFRNNRVGKFHLYFFSITGYNVADFITVSGNTLVGAPAAVFVNGFDTTIRYSNVVLLNNTSNIAYWANPTMEFTRVDGLTVSGNSTPISYSNWAMATVALSCSVNVSGNTLSGSSIQVSITSYSGCP
jgi:hypothetical protein